MYGDPDIIEDSFLRTILSMNPMKELKSMCTESKLLTKGILPDLMEGLPEANDVELHGSQWAIMFSPVERHSLEEQLRLYDTTFYFYRDIQSILRMLT